MLEIDNLSVKFLIEGQYYAAVSDLSLTIKAGETLALLGESGCGKSLTALAIMQLLPPRAYFSKQAKISLLGRDLLLCSEYELRQVRGRQIAMIFQEPMTSLNPVLSIKQQLSEAILHAESLDQRELNSRVIELLQLVELPKAEQRMNDFPHQLSGGQKQRVMIAMAMAARPQLLIADEPTTALDVTIQAQILELLKRLQAKLGMSILLITHDLNVVKMMADSVAVMYSGELLEQCSAKRFFAKLAHPYSQKLLDSLPSVEKREQQLNYIEGMVPGITEKKQGCCFYNRCEQAYDACLIKPKLEKLIKNHRVRCHLYKVNNQVERVNGPVNAIKDKLASVGEPLLSVNALSVSFPVKKGLFKRKVDDFIAVDNVSFDLHKGETLALVGESGCGKTTLSRAIMGLLPVSKGQICYNKQCLSSLSRKENKQLRHKMQIIFQDPFSSMNPRLLVEDIIIEGLVAQERFADPKQRRAHVLTLLDHVGLPKSSLSRYPHQFSGGQRQRIAIARALAVSPELIICDEPTSALDVSVQAQILNLLRELQTELGLAYLFISHDLSVVSYLAHRIMVMKSGQIVECKDTSSLLSSPKHAYSQQLLSAAAF